MAQAEHAPKESLDMIEQAILPSLAMLIEDATAARPGCGLEAHAAELRAIARRIGALTELVAAVTPQPASSRDRMSA